MKSKIVILVTALITGIVLFSKPSISANSYNHLKLTIVYNNIPYHENLTTAWGFSCLIQGLDKTVLFDTGGNGNILLSNMKKLKIDPKQINLVILSHIHGDHTGGLWEFLKENSEVTVYFPKSFPEEFKDKVEDEGARIVLVKKPVKIHKDIYSTGELGTWIKEQSLILKTKKGLVIITGCAHPGIVKIVRFSKEWLEDRYIWC